LLEQQPFADADASYFEEEKYGTVSALLGEGAKPFLGIPLGPLQIGHFTMSLGISLMAFVEYPGFPLTNLPTPVRDALQGGTSRIQSCSSQCVCLLDWLFDCCLLACLIIGCLLLSSREGKHSPFLFRLSGLGVVYSVNMVLAVIAAFKCKDRGQPVPLWVAKTVFVGGVAYDQLTQLPTFAEIEEEKNRKGARAAKNNKNKKK
jgi:hypothetical protein